MAPIQRSILSPGALLQELLKNHNIKQSDLAEKMGRSSQYITDVVKGKKAMDAELALELEQVFDVVSAKEWLEYELTYKRSLLKNTPSRMSVLAKHPYATELIKLKWVESANSPEELDQNLTQFWNDCKHACNFRASSAHTTDDIAKQAWSTQVYRLAMRRSVPDYDKNKLPELIAKLKSIMGIPGKVAEVPALIESYGIRFVFLGHLKKCPVDGVALFNKGKPYIGMSLRTAKFDSFWFILLHELAHIKYEHVKIQADNIEISSSKLNLSKEDEDKEKEADLWARENILPTDVYENFRRRGDFTLATITREAMRNKIHNSMLIGRLKKDGILSWDQFAREHVSVRESFVGQIKK